MQNRRSAGNVPKYTGGVYRTLPECSVSPRYPTDNYVMVRYELDTDTRHFDPIGMPYLNIPVLAIFTCMQYTLHGSNSVENRVDRPMQVTSIRSVALALNHDITNQTKQKMSGIRFGKEQISNGRCLVSVDPSASYLHFVKHAAIISSKLCSITWVSAVSALFHSIVRFFTARSVAQQHLIFAIVNSDRTPYDLP